MNSLRQAILDGRNYPFTHATIHASATRPKYNDNVDTIRKMHLDKGWSDVGYHLVIRRDGEYELGRPFHRQGSQVRGHNKFNFGICLIGGVSDDTGKPENNYTEEQFQTLRDVLSVVCSEYQILTDRIKGHRDWFGDSNGDGVIDSRDWLKECPCFDVQDLLKSWQ